MPWSEVKVKVSACLNRKLNLFFYWDYQVGKLTLRKKIGVVRLKIKNRCAIQHLVSDCVINNSIQILQNEVSKKSGRICGRRQRLDIPKELPQNLR